MKNWIGLFLMAGLAMGCSDDEEPAAQTREGFCDEWGKRACSSEVVSVCKAEDESDCNLKQESFCQELLPDDFVDDHAASCLDAVEAAYADADLTADELVTVLQLGPPCDRLIRGPRSAGDDCSSTFECDAAAGYVCLFKGSQTEGTCELPRTVQPGLSCEARQETCTEGFYCNGDNCVGGKDAGSDCATDQECDAENYCANDLTCTPRLDLQADCTDDSQCLSGICFAFGSERTCVDRIRLSPSEPLCDELR
jgi:hypothetical protein